VSSLVVRVAGTLERYCQAWGFLVEMSPEVVELEPSWLETGRAGEHPAGGHPEVPAKAELHPEEEEREQHWSVVGPELAHRAEGTLAELGPAALRPEGWGRAGQD